jgi:serine phosphatase RsbU (regulator of sigma subunit)
MAVLVRTQGSHLGKWVYPVGQRCVLGRHTECDVADVFQDNKGVSRFHAQVEVDGGRYFLEDRGSRNGTFLNGQRITGRTPLRSGDRITIADVELTFSEEAGVGRAAAPPPAPLKHVSFGEPVSPQIAVSRLSMSDSVVPATPPTGYSGEKLQALAKMLQRLGRSLDVNVTLDELLAGLFAIFTQARRGFVAFCGEGDEVTPRATRFHHDEQDPRVRISRSLVRHVLSKKEAVLWADSGPPSDLPTGTLCEMQIRSLMCAPLLDIDGNPFGVVQIDTDQPLRAFNSEDLEVMVGAVSQAAVAVRFARLHEEALHRQAVQRDLELARRVQLGLLPVGYPSCEDFEYFAYYHAAFEVGGDYYDFIELPGDRIALVVADAAGKGVSAALMMAKLSGELKYHLSCEAPGAALARMNDSLCNSDTGRFVTLLAAIQERHSPVLTLVNGGHPAPLRRRPDGTVEAVGEAARGTALGLLPGRTYQELRTTVEPGEVWFMYTDGFTEAINAREEMYGAARLAQQLAQAPGVVREAGERIVGEVRAFLGDQPQSDDMCLVGWGRLGPRGSETGGTLAFRPGDVMPTQKLEPVLRSVLDRAVDRGK